MEIIGQIKKRVGAADMPISETLAQKRFFCVFERITDFVSARA